MRSQSWVFKFGTKPTIQTNANELIAELTFVGSKQGHLIAAAPELLQELRNAKLSLELTLPDTHPMMIRIAKAITRAEGGAQ